MTLSTGSTFPSGVKFTYVPLDLAYVEEAPALSCGKPFPLDVDQLFEKNSGDVLFVSAPGAFTPPCTENHLPPFLNHLQDLKQKYNITTVVVLTVNDPFVNSAWEKLLLKQVKLPATDLLPHLVFASDVDLKFAKASGIYLDLRADGLGERVGRSAFVVSPTDKKVKFAGVEKGLDVEVSSYESVTANI